MSETRFTPGPWSTHADDDGNESSEIRAQGSLIANVYGVQDFPCITDENTDAIASEMLANAYLIGASPELYQALDRIYSEVRGVTQDGDDDWMALLGECRAALAKARGESR